MFQNRLSIKDNLFYCWFILVDSQLCLIGRGTTASVDHLFFGP